MEPILCQFQTINPSLDLFNELLMKHPDVFHPARTTRSLYQHWLHMRQYRVLLDQKALPLPQGEYVMNFSGMLLTVFLFYLIEPYSFF